MCYDTNAMALGKAAPLVTLVFLTCASNAQNLGDFRGIIRSTNRGQTTRNESFLWSGPGSTHIYFTGNYTNLCRGSSELDNTGHWSDPFRILYEAPVGPFVMVDKVVQVPANCSAWVTISKGYSAYTAQSDEPAAESLAGERYLLGWSPTAGFGLGWFPVTLSRTERKFTSYDGGWEIRQNRPEAGVDPSPIGGGV